MGAFFYAFLNQQFNDKSFFLLYTKYCQQERLQKNKLNIWIIPAINSMNKVRQYFEVCGNSNRPGNGWGAPSQPNQGYFFWKAAVV